MSEYSVAEAKDQLSRLLDRVLAGEDVTITRRGKPIVRLQKASEAVPAKTSGPIDVEWLHSIRVTPTEPTDAVDLVRQVRGHGG
ncbi:MAG: type II toxin-antitoxin system prevent-host-death family antitoxin [Brevundimonas sp.]|uniref:type II toxin-antitoxin system Phd/YefM family antitoxin n=1 Tax=Brevundimonas sp. TaxID=1871086 RepID=UPI0025BA49B3|nr:type II toxin-antitoxin system prevent-host-death family antitoxin [Brevundimonas sp.]MBX3476934.1 type II toxin-antitoxin system prevent-host-death family antitoxin [Brevundimonas sp.]